MTPVNGHYHEVSAESHGTPQLLKGPSSAQNSPTKSQSPLATRKRKRTECCHAPPLLKRRILVTACAAPASPSPPSSPSDTSLPRSTARVSGGHLLLNWSDGSLITPDVRDPIGTALRVLDKCRTAPALQPGVPEGPPMALQQARSSPASRAQPRHAPAPRTLTTPKKPTSSSLPVVPAGSAAEISPRDWARDPRLPLRARNALASGERAVARGHAALAKCAELRAGYAHRAVEITKLRSRTERLERTHRDVDRMLAHTKRMIA